MSPAAALLARLQKGGAGHSRQADGSDMTLGDIAGVARGKAMPANSASPTE